MLWRRPPPKETTVQHPKKPTGGKKPIKFSAFLQLRPLGDEAGGLERSRVQELAEPLATGRVVFVQKLRPRANRRKPELPAGDISSILADKWLKKTVQQREAFELEAWRQRELQWESRHKKPAKPTKAAKPPRDRPSAPDEADSTSTRFRSSGIKPERPPGRLVLRAKKLQPASAEAEVGMGRGDSASEHPAPRKATHQVPSRHGTAQHSTAAGKSDAKQSQPPQQKPPPQQKQQKQQPQQKQTKTAQQKPSASNSRHVTNSSPRGGAPAESSIHAMMAAEMLAGANPRAGSCLGGDELLQGALPRGASCTDGDELLQGMLPRGASCLEGDEMLQGVLPRGASCSEGDEMLAGMLPRGASKIGGAEAPAVPSPLGLDGNGSPAPEMRVTLGQQSAASWGPSSPNGPPDGQRRSGERGDEDISVQIAENPCAETLDLRKGSTYVDQLDARNLGITVRDALLAAFQDGLLLIKHPGVPGQPRCLPQAPRPPRRMKLLVTSDNRVVLEKTEATPICGFGWMRGKRQTKSIVSVQVTSRRWNPNIARVILTMQDGQRICYAAADLATHHTTIEALNAALLMANGEVQATDSLSLLPRSPLMVFDS